MASINDTPGYRGVVTAFFDGIVCMLNPYPKPWKFRMVRREMGWDGPVWQPQLVAIDLDGSTAGASQDAEAWPQTSRFIKAMNPAHILYETFTNREWGRGYDRSVIDEFSWLEAANQLKNERLGLCLKWSQSDSIENFVQVILDHIGGAVYPDRQTGKLRLKLIRNDYTFASVPLFTTKTGILEITDAPVAAPGNLITECIVTYRDPITDSDRQVRVKNTAALQANGGVTNSIKRTYRGIPTAELALRVAQRDLRASSSRLRKFSLTMDRRAASIYPGDVIRIRDVVRNIPDMAVRVGTYDDGTITDSRIKLVVTQDVFSMPATSYVENEPAQWAAPTTRPCVGRHRAFELPYGMALRALSAADFGALSGTGAMYGVVCEEGQPLNVAYNTHRKYGAPDASENPPDDSFICPI